MVRLTDVRDKENAFGSWCPGQQLSGLRRRERRASAAGGDGGTARNTWRVRWGLAEPRRPACASHTRQSGACVQREAVFVFNDVLWYVMNYSRRVSGWVFFLQFSHRL